MDIARGQRVKLQDAGLAAQPFSLRIDLAPNGLSLDLACFGLDATRRLSDERYMTFFNQPTTPCGAVRLEGAGSFHFDLGRLPASIDALVVTLAIDGGGTLNALGACVAHFSGANGSSATHRFSGNLFSAERALMMLELYRKDGAWRLNAVGQGFNGGLDALIVHFGGTVAQPPAAAPRPPAAAPSPPALSKLSLEKRVEREAPQLVSLVKQAKISLDKAGLSDHTARVCLCLDISASMTKLYDSGAVQRFAERVLALGCRFDDDGAVDVFLFGDKVHQPEPMTLANCSQYVRTLTQRFPLEGNTRYGAALATIRSYYFGELPWRGPQQVRRADSPVYVMFVTDGSTADQKLTEDNLRESSREPIFWQFMGIGRTSKKKSFFSSLLDADFSFLEKLDALPGRLLDNAGFFAVEQPDEHPDDRLYDLLMKEYPGWVRQARTQGMIP